jgi:plastocyanin
MNRQRFLAGGVLGLLGLVGLLAAAGSVAAAGPTVNMGEANERYFYAPTTTFVNVGSAVTWTNGTDKPHTVTSDSGSELDSGTVDASKMFSHTFSAVGTFSYHCTIHPYMVAKVVVLAAGVTPPPTNTLRGQAPTSGTPSVGLAAGLILGLAGAGLILRRLRSGA